MNFDLAATNSSSSFSPSDMDSYDLYATNESMVGNSTVCNCNNEAIQALCDRTGYKIEQENGQRKYGPAPNWTGSVPNRGCEVFVGKLPRDCFEDEIVPLFERIGLIYEVRLMMEFSGYNRGFAFVLYTKRDDAKRAVRELNNYEIRKDKSIGVCHSIDNCRLFVGGIPKNKKKEEIFEEISKVTQHVKDVIVYPSAHDKTKNRGFAFVEYENHRAAAMARRKLNPGRIQLWGHQIAVDWAEPEPEVDDDVMANVKILYVRNLMLSTTEERIRQEFEAFKPNSIERVKKLKDFAFVHFKERKDAEYAREVMNGKVLDGSLIEVTFAKPADKSNQLKVPKNVLNQNLLLTGPCLTQTTFPLGQLPFYPYTYLPTSTTTTLPNSAPSSDLLYDIYTDPTALYQYNQVQMQTINPTNPIQTLEELCNKNGLGNPVYTLNYSTAGRDTDDNEVKLYLYKISIQGYLNGAQISPKALSRSPDEAKILAAEFAFDQLCAQFQALIPMNDFYTPSAIYQAAPALSQSPTNSTTSQQSIAPLPTSLPTTVPYIFYEPTTQYLYPYGPTTW